MTCLNNNLSRDAIRLTLAASAVAAASFLVGCGEDPPPPPPPPPPPKVAVEEAPKVTPIDELMKEYDIDPRVKLAERDAPETNAQRIAVLKFYDAFARGNADALKAMLSAPDQLELDRMTASGVFKSVTEPITRIDVRCGRQGSELCAFSIYHVGEELQPQLWTYKVEKGTDQDASSEFDSVATPPKMLDRLEGSNPIAKWFEIVLAEMARATEPDEMVEIQKQDLTVAAPAEAESRGAAPMGPSTPGAPGKRVPGAPIAPPKPPAFR